MSEIPDWAFNRVVELAGGEPTIPDDKPHVAQQRAFARYIAEHEEPPVIVDPDVLVVREVLHAHQRAMTPPDSGWGDMSYHKGSYDLLPAFQAALEAYKKAKGSVE